MRRPSRKGKQFPVLNLLGVIEHQTMYVLFILFPLRVLGGRIREVFKEFIMNPLMQQEKRCLGAFIDILEIVQELHDIIEGALYLQQGSQTCSKFLQLDDVHIVMMNLLRLNARSMLVRVKMFVIVNLTL
jgi:hypothetical protein